MASATRRYSLAHPPPVDGALDGRETAHEAEILEMQALQADRDGEGSRSVLLMERALQIRCQLVSQLRERWSAASSVPGVAGTAANGHRMSLLSKPDTTSKEDLLLEYQTQCSELHDAAERLVVRCNGLGVEHFKRDAFDDATPLLDYAMQLTEDGAYPLCEVEERRRHLRGVTLNNFGCLERRRGHFSEALQYMKSSMEMTGVESPVAYMNTSAILIQLRLSDEAVRMAERAIELLYQTPEDPSLLAVAHHNLAMALEPVHPARCLEEYALAYRTACATLGPESETSRAIQRSWERFEATRGPPGNGRFLIPGGGGFGGGGGGGAASRLRGLVGAAPAGLAVTAPHRLPTAAQSHGVGGKNAAGSPIEVGELFPHPFLPSASAPAAPSKTPRDVTPMYRPAAVPRRPLVPSPPPGVGAGASSSTTSASRSRAPPPQPHAHSQPPPRPHAAEKTVRPSPPPARAAAAAHRPTPPSRAAESGAAAATSAAVSSGSRPAARMSPSPPPSRHQRQPQPQPRQAAGATATATAARRYSPAARTQEPSRQSPPRGGTTQRRLSEQRGASTAGAPVRAEKPASRSTTERATAPPPPPPPSSSSLAASPLPTRGPRRPTRDGAGAGTAAAPLPLPRNLPPLQGSTGTTAAAAAVAVAPPPAQKALAHPRSSRDAGAAAAVPSTEAPSSLESDPLTFLQHRLDILLQDEGELENKYAQAMVIQRHYRGHLARRRAAALRTTRARDARLAELRRHMAARRIQRVYRRHRRHNRYPLAAGQLGRYASAGGRRGAQHHAATQLQRVARGWLARRHYAQMRRYARESPAAATRIQRWIRASLARRHYAALRADKARQEAEAREHERRQYAATRIQGQWRTFVQRRACKVALRNRMIARAAEEARRRVRAAICIQSAWRGYQARRLYSDTYSRTSRLRAARLEYEHRRQAAVRLQAFGRMLIAKQHALPLLTSARFRAAAAIQVRSREGRAATTIQCAYRRHLARRVCAAKRAAREAELRTALLHARTATVQRAGRGYLARKGVGARLAVLQAEAERYERRLRAIKQQELEAARVAQAAAQHRVSLFTTSEAEERQVLGLAEQQQRHTLQVQCRVSLSVAKEATAQAAARGAASPTLRGFVRVIKAKRERARRQAACDAYLDRCDAEDADAHLKASARVVTGFMRGATARSLVLSRAQTMQSYNDARAMHEEAANEAEGATPTAAGAGAPVAAVPGSSEQVPVRPKRSLRAPEAVAERAAATPQDSARHTAAPAAPPLPPPSPPPRVAEQESAANAVAVAPLPNHESLAEEEGRSAHQPRRPLTAEQVDAERVLLDRLGRAEQLASEAGASTPSRPLTPEQIAAERAALDVLAKKVKSALEREPVAAAERPLTAEQVAAERTTLDELVSAEQRMCAGEPPAQTRPLTAEQVASERATLDRLKREEQHTGGAADSARPLTPQQIEAERVALDRLAREEASVVTGEGVAGARRAPTPERVEAEREALNRLERVEDAEVEEEERAVAAGPAAGQEGDLLPLSDASMSTSELAAEMLARQRAVWQAEVAAEKHRRQQREKLQQATFEYKQQRIAAAEGSEELAPYRMGRIRMETWGSGAAGKVTAAAEAEASAAAANKYRQARAAQELAAVRCIERHVIACGARRYLAALRTVRDEYLDAMQDFDRLDGPVLTDVRLREVLARYPGLRTRVVRDTTPAPPARRPVAAIADWPVSTTASRKTLRGFVRVIKAKGERARRQAARDAYLDRCDAEDADAHLQASARVVTGFMRGATARSLVLSRAQTMQSYNDARAMQEEEAEAKEGATPTAAGAGAAASAAASRIQRFIRGVLARRRLARLQEAQRAYLEEEVAVEELLHEAALTIQRLYRGHRARQQAAMAIVQRDLYVLSLGADEAEAEEAAGRPPASSSSCSAKSTPKTGARGTPAFTPRPSTTSSASTAPREVASTAVITEVNEAEEAALDRLLHRP
ncbi:Flagellar Member 7 [Novymonas esmeraldas]|uniref:Flagellar Member 7 n=1 Tax=Novymonas esmeraldas TaxID=1808958 RepID=A0AAW0EQP6_9TRYP